MEPLMLPAGSFNDKITEARNVWRQYMFKLKSDSYPDHTLRLTSTVASHRASANFLASQVERLNQSERPRLLIIFFERNRSSQDVPESKISNLKTFLLANKKRWESVSMVNTAFLWKPSEIARLLEALVGAENLRHLMIRGLGCCGNSLFAHRLKEVLLSAPKFRCFQLRCARSSFDLQTEEEIGQAFMMNRVMKTLELEEVDHGNCLVESLAQSQCQLEVLSLRGNGLHNRLWCLETLVKVVEHQRELTSLNLSENEAMLDWVTEREHRQVNDFFMALKNHEKLTNTNLGGCRAPRRVFGDALQLFVDSAKMDFSIRINGLQFSRKGSSKSLLIGSCSTAIFAQTTDMEAVLGSLIEVAESLDLNQLVLERCLLWGENCGGLLRNYLASAHCRLTSLELRSCRFCPVASTEIAAGIRACSDLTQLTIQSCEIRRFMVDRLFSGGSLGQLANIRELDLSGNELSNSSLPLITAFLETNSNLESLDLSGNHDLLRSGDDGFSNFLQILVRHEKLKKLAISRDDETSNMCNELGDVMAALVSHSSNLRELDLRKALNLEVRDAWVTKIPQLQSLRVLRLPRGMQNRPGWFLFQLHLHYNQSLTRMDIGGAVPGMPMRKFLRRNYLVRKARSLQDVPTRVWPTLLRYFRSNHMEGSPVFEFLRKQEYPIAS